MTAAATPKQERPHARVLGDGDEPAMEEDREDEGRQEDAKRDRQSAGPAPGDVADEGREDHRRRGQHAAEREAVDELALG